MIPLSRVVTNTTFFFLLLKSKILCLGELNDAFRSQRQNGRTMSEMDGMRKEAVVTYFEA
jgi:hypothetical protein